MTTTISSTDDLIDVRDVIARVEHLEQLEQPGAVDLGAEDNAQAQDDLFAELATLRALLAELEGNGGDEQWRGDWYPVTMIRDSYFKVYAMYLAEDIGAIQADAKWPNNCIDWEQAARELRMDYTSVTFDGVDYWVR